MIFLCRKLCDDIIGSMKITNGTTEKRILNAPVQMSLAAEKMEDEGELIKSVFMVTREDVSVSNEEVLRYKLSKENIPGETLLKLD